MMRIDAGINGKEYGFLTNDNGEYLFELSGGSTKQLSCDSGFNSLRKIKKAIRSHLEFKPYHMSEYDETSQKMPRLTYEIRDFDEWRK
jgi:hypothetical protein